jgi:hypothetical protein
MTLKKKSTNKAEFGDFQTPIELAQQVCSLLFQHGLNPRSILEPTCGEGSFILAALESFPNVSNIVGVEINNEHIKAARAAIVNSASSMVSTLSINIIKKDFFEMNWDNLLESLPDPLLVIGNPPWITNADLGRIGSANLPDKTNAQNHRGIDAITGKSNFDISEWMLNKVIEWLIGRNATLAILCKNSVARKVLQRAWKNRQPFRRSEIYHIDTPVFFNAAVDACLLVISFFDSSGNFDCQVYANLKEAQPTETFGYRQETLVANIEYFERWKHLQGKSYYRWRSGIKHDCAKVMEFRKEINGYRNGYGELVDLEDEYLYPMLKSSEIATDYAQQPTRLMLVTQHIAGEDTNQIRYLASKTWQYLHNYANLLDKRASSVYRNRPRFSLFGIGNYTFALWKVAISGFYKHLSFKVVGPFIDKPVVLDDTCYFIPCRSEQEACYIAELLNSNVAKEFFSAFIFWDEKRPITVDILKRLDLLALARELGTEETFKQHFQQYPQESEQPLLFAK